MSSNDLVRLSQANSAFNAQQAQINRDWQTEMSNTAHQREVSDLLAAGLNPILSANSGASVGSVGNADADTSAISALGSISAASIAAKSAQTVAAINGVTGIVERALSNPQAAAALGIMDLIDNTAYANNGITALYGMAGVEDTTIEDTARNTALRWSQRVIPGQESWSAYV